MESLVFFCSFVGRPIPTSPAPHLASPSFLINEQFLPSFFYRERKREREHHPCFCLCCSAHPAASQDYVSYTHPRCSYPNGEIKKIKRKLNSRLPTASGYEFYSQGRATKMEKPSSRRYLPYPQVNTWL